MNRYLSFFLLIFLLAGLAYSTYSFSQGRFMEGMLIFPLLIGCYLFIMAWQKQKDDQDGH
jgi:hypothetical protein